MSVPSAPILQMENISKRFGRTVANAAASIEVGEGEIFALVGENGAGKSVLMSILCGVLTPDAGRILFKGQPLKLGSPLEATRHRIGMVHQHFMLVPSLTVAENYVLGQGSPLRPLWRTTNVAARIAELSRRYGLEVRPDAFVRDLSVGERQRVEILRILFQGAELIVLDEPTAVLTPDETDRLLKLMRELARDRKTVIFISHKLDEVMRVSDRVSVMRDGRVVFSASTQETNPRELARQMVGRDVPTDLPARAASPGQVVFSVDNLHCRNDLGLPAVRGVSFVIRQGEIVGVAGVSGNGQSELARALVGLIAATEGTSVTVRCDSGKTGVITVTVSFAAFGFCVVVLAVAVSVITGGGVPPVGTTAAGPLGVTMIVTFARAPAASVPMLAVRTPVAATNVVDPWVAVALLNVTFGSSVLTSTTPLAVLGPVLVTVTT